MRAPALLLLPLLLVGCDASGLFQEAPPPYARLSIQSLDGSRPTAEWTNNDACFRTFGPPESALLVWAQGIHGDAIETVAMHARVLGSLREGKTYAFGGDDATAGYMINGDLSCAAGVGCPRWDYHLQGTVHIERRYRDGLLVVVDAVGHRNARISTKVSPYADTVRVRGQMLTSNRRIHCPPSSD